MSARVSRSISTADEAYWFLFHHPKLNCKERSIAKRGEKYNPKYGSFRSVRDQWTKKRVKVFEWKSLDRHAVETNLDIFYAKVNSSGVVDDDVRKNVNTECWLEFGPVKRIVMDGKVVDQAFHDVRLDSGGPTFDEALISLASKVRKFYGGYRR